MKPAYWIAPCLVLIAAIVFSQAGTKQQPAPTAPLERRSENRIWYPAGSLPKLFLAQDDQRPIRSLLIPGRILDFGDYIWDPIGSPSDPLWVRVDLSRQLLSVFRGPDEIGSAVILYGTDGKPTPLGKFPVLEKDQNHRSNLYDAEMPFMIRLTNDGVAIHASDVRAGSATHGCIGIPAAFAERLFPLIHKGDTVVIVGASAH